jgi:hypothetical protein
VDPLVLPSRVAKLLRRAAEKDGVSLGNFLMDMATARLDPPERARAYAEAAWSFCGRLRRSSPRAI